MNKFGKVAIAAAGRLRQNQDLTPKDAWKKAATQAKLTESMRKKVCPKEAFIGLCEFGYIRGIKRKPSTKNAEYAINAVRVLRQCKVPDPPRLGQIEKGDLWEEARHGVNDPAEKENGQMDVVLALWDNGWIVPPQRRNTP